MRGEASIFANGTAADGQPLNVFIPFLLSRKVGGHSAIRYLVDTFGPRLVNAPFQRNRSAEPPSPYEGETALHVAIVDRDKHLARFLVERGADVRQRCWGPFFAPGGNCY